MISSMEMRGEQAPTREATPTRRRPAEHVANRRRTTGWARCDVPPVMFAATASQAKADEHAG